MCSISGSFSSSFSFSGSTYYTAHCLMAHRGPDDEGFYAITQDGGGSFRGPRTIPELYSLPDVRSITSAKLLLSQNRLSIIDLSPGGHQPYEFADKVIVFNGEIYNYIELRKVLIGEGLEFQTESDTEVLLKAYIRWGTDAFNRLNGMWAAAIYDSKDESLVLTRDRFGIKPLYYTRVGTTLHFGSEIKFCLKFTGKLKSNPLAVKNYLSDCLIDYDGSTFFSDIFQVLPGHYIKFSGSDFMQKRYYRRGTVPFGLGLESELANSIRLRFRSDVEVGTLLSGGIDSSLIVNLIKDVGISDQLNTYTVDFDEAEFSERKYVDCTLRKTSFHGTYVKYTPDDFLTDLKKLIWHQEIPFRSLAVYSQFKLYKYIGDNTDTVVLLNGQGADELFSGYSTHYKYFLASLILRCHIKKAWREIHIVAGKTGKKPGALLKLTIFTLLRHLAEFFLGRRLTRDVGSNFLRLGVKIRRILDPFKFILWFNFNVSALREYLHYEDRNSTAFGRESRLPYLDFNLVEYAWSLRPSEKMKDGVTKRCLREASIGHTPTEILDRTDKMGFISPQSVWQRKELALFLQETADKIRDEGIFDYLENNKLAEEIDAYLNGSQPDYSLAWRIVSLYHWKNTFFA